MLEISNSFGDYVLKESNDTNGDKIVYNIYNKKFELYLINDEIILKDAGVEDESLGNFICDVEWGKEVLEKEFKYWCYDYFNEEEIPD